MNPTYPESSGEFREKIRLFLDDNLPAGWAGLGGVPSEEVLEFLANWRKILHSERLLAPQWPAEYGGG
ncbi:MAG TPA: acyl-CoA dehydrogenase, partial [Acidimicrobiaceae bacterium]|nr:acyl-CoA dehydrogenase [Acidimicrobiaceae bacterium]